MFVSGEGITGTEIERGISCNILSFFILIHVTSFASFSLFSKPKRWINRVSFWNIWCVCIVFVHHDQNQVKPMWPKYSTSQLMCAANYYHLACGRLLEEYMQDLIFTWLRILQFTYNLTSILFAKRNSITFLSIY